MYYNVNFDFGTVYCRDVLTEGILKILVYYKKLLDNIIGHSPIKYWTGVDLVQFH